MCFICTVEYYSAMKKKDSLTPATPCMHLEDMMLGEVGPTQKDKYCPIPLL